MRFLLVDRVTQLEVGSSIEGYKCWTTSEDVFREHFPSRPIVPGVLLVESMAQLMGFLLEESYRREFGTDLIASAILGIIHKAKFRRFVVPGDRVDMKGNLISLDRKRASCRVQASVGGMLRAEADLSFVLFAVDPSAMDRELRAQRESYRQAVFVGLVDQTPAKP